MRLKEAISRPGISAALGAALLFGAGTPFAKLLLESVSPWLLAGLLYLGAGIGLSLYRYLKHAPGVRLSPREFPWLAGAIVAGGIVGPVLLLFGLRDMPASGASLLLNAESVFTALLAWFAFKENFDHRIALGMLAIVVGAVILSAPWQAHLSGLWPGLAVLDACLAWGIDNNLTRKVSLADASWIASIKGWVSGIVNLGVAFILGSAVPSIGSVAGGMALGLMAYGVSLALYVLALRDLGTARTGAYFSIAPFFGAVLAVLMGDAITIPLIVAGLLMALGVWLHITERHEHEHVHEELEHTHSHVHDEHHQHEHPYPVAPGTRHTHWHRHEPIVHTHPHFPDAHHRHRH